MNISMQNSVSLSTRLLYFFIFSFSLLITGCTERRIERIKYGRFIYEDHMIIDKLKWEGGNTFRDKGVFYRDDGELRIEDRDLEVEPNVEEGFIVVKDKSRLLFFDSRRGITVHCETQEIEKRLQHRKFGYWFGISYILLSEEIPDYPMDPAFQLDLFTISGDTCSEKTLVTLKDRDYSYAGFNVSADHKGLAWILCNPDCRMEWIFSGEETTRTKELGCDKDSLLDVEWVDGKPEPRHAQNFGKRACRDASGQLKFPEILPPDRRGVMSASESITPIIN